MTDVRLTATNPADSSVVPVLCNEKGELKLEEPIEWDGTFAGDVEFGSRLKMAGGSAAGTIKMVDSSNTAYASSGKIAFYGAGRSEDNEEYAYINGHFTGNNGGPGNVQSGEIVLGTRGTDRLTVNTSGRVYVDAVASGPSLSVNGSFTVKGGKAGFTDQGVLYCATERDGTLVKLIDVQNGVGIWSEVTQAERLEWVGDDNSSAA